MCASSIRIIYTGMIAKTTTQQYHTVNTAKRWNGISTDTTNGTQLWHWYKKTSTPPLNTKTDLKDLGCQPLTKKKKNV